MTYLIVNDFKENILLQHITHMHAIAMLNSNTCFQNTIRALNSLDSDLAPVSDPEGVQGVRSNPPLRQNYSIFMENFQKVRKNNK